MLGGRVTVTDIRALAFVQGLGDFGAEPIHLLQVLPEVVGWSLRGPCEPVFFLSGRRAEHAGRTLAQALARNGDAVELRISDRSGDIAGRLVFGGPAAVSAPPSLAATSLQRSRASSSVAAISHG